MVGHDGLWTVICEPNALSCSVCAAPQALDKDSLKSNSMVTSACLPICAASSSCTFIPSKSLSWKRCWFDRSDGIFFAKNSFRGSS